MVGEIASRYLKNVEKSARGIKSVADRALAQVKDEELSVAIDEESNSITKIMKHISGKMIHSWADPFASLEDRPVRDRDSEFVVKEGDTRKAVFETWNEAWNAFFEALSQFTPDDLLRTITEFGGREFILLEALNNHLVHYSRHVGQIIFLAKHFRGSDWKSLSTPRKR
jgi:uncharacterized damage-inducible protein DinB